MPGSTLSSPDGIGAKSSNAIDPGTPDEPSYKIVGRCFRGKGRLKVVLFSGSEQAMCRRIGHGDDEGWMETSWESGDGSGRLASYAEIDTSTSKSYEVSTQRLPGLEGYDSR